MPNQLINIKYYIFKTQKKAVLNKKFNQTVKINDKKRILILLKILGQIQQDNKDARNDTEKSISVICKEEGISFEQVFYILFFFMLYLLVIDHPSTLRVENLF